MSLSPAVIDALVAAGATVEQLAAAVKADIADGAARLAEKREKDAARQRRSRSNRSGKGNVTVTPRDSADAPLNDIYSKPPEPISAKADTAPFAEKVKDCWNGMAKANGLDTVRKIVGARLKHLMARRKEHGEEAVFEAIEKLGASDWHCGRKSDWKADFNWLFESPKHFEKILERSDGQAAKPSRAMTASELRQGIRFNEDQGNYERAEELKRQLALLQPPIPPPIIREAAEKLRANR